MSCEIKVTPYRTLFEQGDLMLANWDDGTLAIMTTRGGHQSCVHLTPDECAIVARWAERQAPQVEPISDALKDSPLVVRNGHRQPCYCAQCEDW